MSSEVKRYDAVHIRYGENNIRYGEGLGVEMVTARDYDALHAEAEALRLLAAECDEYLRTDPETSIGSGSILHRKLTEAALSAQGGQ